MNRRNIAQLTLCLLAVGMGGLLFGAASRRSSKVGGIKQLPEINVFTIYGERFDSADYLDSTKRTALLFFHPECEYCRKEVEGILARHREMRRVQWLFITLAPTEVVEEFLAEHPLESIPDAYVLRENWPDTYEQFGVKGPPALFIYDENGNLMKRYMGATSIKTIVQDLQ